jgi:SnoaL-like domain
MTAAGWTMDMTRNWRLAADRYAVETDPRRRTVLAVIIEHAQAEATLDLDRLMATVADNPSYHFWGPDGDSGPKGRDNLRAYYAQFIGSGCHRVEFDVDRLIVDDGGAFTEGWMRIAWPGRVLQAMGRRPDIVDDPDALYLYEARSSIVWVIDDDGKVVSEDSYTDNAGFNRLRKLSPHELPD